MRGLRNPVRGSVGTGMCVCDGQDTNEQSAMKMVDDKQRELGEGVCGACVDG